MPARLASYTLAAARMAGRVDVVDAHFALYALLPVTLTRLRRLPLVVHFQGPWADESAVTRPRAALAASLKRPVERAVYRRADEVVVLSEAFRALLVSRYRVAPWRIEVIPPAVDLERFRPGDRRAARSSLGLPADAFVAVAARRLDPRMGVEVLLDAWGGVLEEHPGAVLLVVGTGALRPALEARAVPFGDAVRFLGQVSDDQLVAAYQAADTSVVPTVALEGFGLVVLESLAAGTPVITSDAGGLPEAVAGLDGSVVVPAGEVGALRVALLASAAGAGPSPTACRAYAERFSSDALARRHRRLYARAARGDRRPRVLYLDHCAQLSGGELALARLLPALDVDAHVVLGEDGPLVGLLERQGTSVEVLALDPALQAVRKGDVRPGRLPVAKAVAAAATVLRLRRRIRELGPDVIHTNSLKSALYGGAAGRLAGVPVVWHVRDRIADDYLPVAAVRLVRRLARVLPAAVIANSQSTLATLGPLERAAVVPSPVVGVEREVRERAGSGPLVVGMVGRLAPWKGQDVFLAAFAAAFPGGGARAVLVGGALFGEEEHERRLVELIGTLGLDGRVELRGHVDDVPAVLDELDVLVHASVIPEPFGQVVVEGMAAGVAVIASGAGGPAEVVTDGLDGLLHQPGDVDGLAACLRTLAADPVLRASLASAGRLRALDFTPERVAPIVMDLYRRVSEGQRR